MTPLKAPEEDKEIWEATTSPTAALEISVDAVASGSTQHITRLAILVVPCS